MEDLKVGGSRVARSITLGIVLCVLIAVLVQDFSDYLTKPLFNKHMALYAKLSRLFVAGSAFATVVLGVGLFTRRWSRLARLLPKLLLAFVLLELSLLGLDKLAVSRSESALGGPYHEHRTEAGRLVIKKPHPGSPHGFRTDAPYAKTIAAPRVLFLGDSYTEGTGTTLETNYPNVVEARLREELSIDVEVMNAGVNGYGPNDSRRMLHHLAAEGYEFDMVLFNLFLLNDMTDNLPRTTRRVVAGVNYRFPESAFLRLFHPLNTYAARYGIFVMTMVRARSGAVDRNPDPNIQVPKDYGRFTPQIAAQARNRLDLNYGATSLAAEMRAVRDDIHAMRDFADEAGVPFALVVFPDPLLADPSARAQMNLVRPLENLDLERFRRWVDAELSDLDLIDTTEVLATDPRFFGEEDPQHLSDLGNQRAGALVADTLALMLASPD